MALDSEARALGVVLGGNIAEMRRRAGLSQTKVAARAGFHPILLSRIERGLQQPRLVSILRICGALEASGAEIFGDLSWSPPRSWEECKRNEYLRSRVVAFGSWQIDAPPKRAERCLLS